VSVGAEALQGFVSNAELVELRVGCRVRVLVGCEDISTAEELVLANEFVCEVVGREVTTVVTELVPEVLV
jgi:hypothetical protein